jgi:hypothetical protein
MGTAATNEDGVASEKVYSSPQKKQGPACNHWGWKEAETTVGQSAGKCWQWCRHPPGSRRAVSSLPGCRCCHCPMPAGKSAQEQRGGEQHIQRCGFPGSHFVSSHYQPQVTPQVTQDISGASGEFSGDA